jgi:hypothetical protein
MDVRRGLSLKEACEMDFVVYILVIGVLYLRPQDFIPGCVDLQVYQTLLIGGCIVACRPMLGQLTAASLVRRPISFCVLGLLPAIALSHLWQGNTYDSRVSVSIFFDKVLIFMLGVAVVNTPERLLSLLRWLLWFTAILAVIGILDYHGIISLEQFRWVQERRADEVVDESTRRLYTIGLFGDPNDMCLLLYLGIALSAFRLGDPRSSVFQLLWLAMGLLFLYCLALTHSRGGFLGFLVGFIVFCQQRFGVWKAGAFSVTVIPLLFVVFAGRQTNITLSGEDTGQSRIQLWSEGLEFFRESPAFGIGQGMFAERCSDKLVAHNSFLHCFAELGFLGGSLFLGAFTTALLGLYRRRSSWPPTAIPAELERLRPYLIGLIAAYMTGMMSISRSYIPPTYVILALAASYLAIANPDPAPANLSVNLRFVRRLAAFGVCFLVAIYALVRLTVLHT